MQTGKPSGNQIAFFIFAVWLLAVPVTYWAESMIGAGPELRAWLEKSLHLLLVGLALLIFRPLREASWRALATGISKQSRTEVAIVAASAPLIGFAFAGAYALWWATFEGPAGLAHHISAQGTSSQVLSEALRAPTLATQIVIGVIVGPIVEELVFRAFLFRAWVERHGWVVAMLLSSTVFALLHPFFLAAFLDSIVNTCVYRRTGSLRASILVHGTHNLLVFYPLLGQFILPLDLEYPGDIWSWSGHLIALAAVVITLPIYAWMSRDREAQPSYVELDHVALPR